jgi:hypothetical protein
MLSSRRAQECDCQRLIIVSQRSAGNLETAIHVVKLKRGLPFECGGPRTPIASGVTREPRQVVGDAGPKPLDQLGQERGANPGAKVERVPVRRVVVEQQAARGDVRFELSAAEREQRPHHTAAGARRHARQSGGTGASEDAEQDGLDLIVPVVRGDDVGGTAPPRHLAQPIPSGGAGGGLGHAWAEVEFAQLEGKPVALGERSDRLSDRPTVRLDSVIRVRHDQLESQVW